MGTRITERVVRAAGVGSRKYVIFDEDCAGFGLCVYESGRKGFVLIYRLAGRQRRFTIGTWPSWSVTAAREEAQRLKREIDRGEDPVDGRKSDPRGADGRGSGRSLHRGAPAEAGGHQRRRPEEHAAEAGAARLAAAQGGRHHADGCRPAADQDRRGPGAAGIEAAEGEAPEAAEAAKPTPVRANRVGEVLRKMFNLAIQWRMRTDNPALGFRKRPETARERFLSFEEIGRLADALAATRISARPGSSASAC
jgi:hypothetical protein